MSEVLWFDGEYVSDASVSVMSHVIHYGSGLFEGIMCYRTERGCAILCLDEHIERFFSSASLYYFEVGYSKQELREAIIGVVRRNGFESCYIRPSLFLGTGWDSLTVSKDVVTHVCVSAWELGVAGGVDFSLGVSSYRRISSQMLPMQSKAACNYMNSYLIRTEANNSGYDDCVSLDVNGYVSESSTANVFFVSNGVCYTPDLSCSVLDGITRRLVMRILGDAGIRVVEGKFGRDELALADEIFLTGTACGVKRVTSFERRVLVSDVVGSYVGLEYDKLTSGLINEYEGFLTYVE